MTEEKKFKLDELQDKTEAQSSDENIPIKPSRLEIPKQKLSQAQKELKDTKTSAEKLDILERSWKFDRPNFKWGRLAVMLIGIASYYIKDPYVGHGSLAHSQNDDFDLTPIFMIPDLITFLEKYYVLIFLFMPFYINFRLPTYFQFELSYLGPRLPRYPFNNDVVSAEGRQVLTFKWHEIKDAKLTIWNNLPIIKVTNLVGDEGAIIWNISRTDKEVVRKLLAGFVNKDHPMRMLIDKDLAS